MLYYRSLHRIKTTPTTEETQAQDYSLLNLGIGAETQNSGALHYSHEIVAPQLAASHRWHSDGSIMDRKLLYTSTICCFF